MKKTANIFFSVVFIAIFSVVANAQTTLKILDFSVIPEFQLEPSNKDEITLHVQFKLNKPVEASKVNLWLGSANDNHSVLAVQPVISTTGNVTNLVYNNVNYPIKGYHVNFQVKLTKAQYANYKTATLFVEDINHQSTTKLYYSK